ncbi:MAG TPA: hypothetical protein VFH54_08310 [Mycobacteriales bacterium]|nr:hypothetical protein [Mycobacteriales bacterium]
MRRRLIQVTLAVSVAALSVTGVAGTAQAAAGSVVSHTHLLLTRQLAERTQSALGVGTGCLGTGSPGCLPIPLQYNGGPVEQAGTTNYVVFWEPTGSTVSSTYNSLLTRFFNDIGGSTLYGVATQYYQGSNQQHIVNSSRLGGTWIDTSAYPSSSLTDADIQNEATKAITANGWTRGIGSQVFVFLAEGENECQSSGTCSFSTFCAYHGDFSSAGQTVLYAAMPYAGTDLSGCGTQGTASPNNDMDADAEISITSHELMETVTDPTLSAWFDSTGAEIGDKCAYTYGTTASNGSNITMNGNPYIVQEEFSNAQLGCSLS